MTSNHFPLRSCEDWNIWLNLIRMRTLEDDIWKFIDPNADNHPVLKEPVLADFVLKEAVQPQSGPAATPYDTAEYNRLLAIYNLDLREYLEHKQVMGRLMKLVCDTVDPRSLMVAKHAKSLAETMKILRQHFEPTDHAQAVALRRQFATLCETPNAKELESWLLDWEFMMLESQELNIPELQGDRVLHAFLEAIRPLAARWVETSEAVIKRCKLEGHELTIEKLFRSCHVFLRKRAAGITVSRRQHRPGRDAVTIR